MFTTYQQITCDIKPTLARADIVIMIPYQLNLASVDQSGLVLAS